MPIRGGEPLLDVDTDERLLDLLHGYEDVLNESKTIQLEPELQESEITRFLT
jgi:hypothetical protein